VHLHYATPQPGHINRHEASSLSVTPIAARVALQWRPLNPSSQSRFRLLTQSFYLAIFGEEVL
jgi:hypothetical protein